MQELGKERHWGGGALSSSGLPLAHTESEVWADFPGEVVSRQFWGGQCMRSSSPAGTVLGAHTPADLEGDTESCGGPSTYRIPRW